MSEENNKWPKTVEGAVELVLSTMTDIDKDIIRNTPVRGLMQLQHDWGTSIRNQCGLWNGNKELLKSCGGEWIRPELASGEIMIAVWRKLNNRSIEDANERDMTEESDNNIDDSKVYFLSPKGKEACFRMIAGAAPSDLGISFIEASLFLGLFTMEGKKKLEESKPLDDELRGKLIKTIEEAERLGGMYGEAFRLTRETPE